MALKFVCPPHPQVYGSILYLEECPNLGAPTPKGTFTSNPQKIFENIEIRTDIKFSVDRPKCSSRKF